MKRAPKPTKNEFLCCQFEIEIEIDHKLALLFVIGNEIAPVFGDVIALISHLRFLLCHSAWT